MRTREMGTVGVTVFKASNTKASRLNGRVAGQYYATFNYAGQNRQLSLSHDQTLALTGSLPTRKHCLGGGRRMIVETGDHNKPLIMIPEFVHFADSAPTISVKQQSAAVSDVAGIATPDVYKPIPSMSDLLALTAPSVSTVKTT